jgi:hypothetical protein
MSPNYIEKASRWLFEAASKSSSATFTSAGIAFVRSFSIDAMSITSIFTPTPKASSTPALPSLVRVL